MMGGGLLLAGAIFVIFMRLKAVEAQQAQRELNRWNAPLPPEKNLDWRQIQVATPPVVVPNEAARRQRTLDRRLAVSCVIAVLAFIALHFAAQY